MRKTLIATAVSVAISGSAWAGDITQSSADGDDTLEATSTNTVTATDIGNDKSTGDNRGNDGTAAAEGYGTAAANNGSSSTSTSGPAGKLARNVCCAPASRFTFDCTEPRIVT